MSAMGGSFHGVSVVDLFAGSGALGIECLSRGAESCVFVESSAPALAVLRANLARIGAADLATVVRGDAMAWAREGSAGSIDLALADPPYSKGYAAELVQQFLDHPFARELWVEHRSDESMPTAPGLRQRRYGDTTISTLTAPR